MREEEEPNRMEMKKKEERGRGRKSEDVRERQREEETLREGKREKEVRIEAKRVKNSESELKKIDKTGRNIERRRGSEKERGKIEMVKQNGYVWITYRNRFREWRSGR